ncbi:MAG TPA: hypothetical protein VKH81_21075 [Candidatus Angelobacter sp.]|nr:hypothetical protein [Candidatus Angelobacter sp.]
MILNNIVWWLAICTIQAAQRKGVLDECQRYGNQEFLNLGSLLDCRIIGASAGPGGQLGKPAHVDRSKRRFGLELNESEEEIST